MKNFGYFKKSLLMSAVALSVLSSPANAVDEAVVINFFKKDTSSNFELTASVLGAFKALDDEQWNKFVSAANLMTSNMRGPCRGTIIEGLASIPQEKIDCFSSQIERLMKLTSNKIKFRAYAAAGGVIKTLTEQGTDEKAKAFITVLIEEVNNDQNTEVKGIQILNHVSTAWSRVQTASPDELQKLASQGNVASADPEEELNLRRGLGAQPPKDQEGR